MTEISQGKLSRRKRLTTD